VTRRYALVLAGAAVVAGLVTYGVLALRYIEESYRWTGTS